MRTYLTLQFRWLARHLRDFGIRPWLGYALGAALFAGMSAYLFYRFEYAGWVYAVMALLSTARLSQTDRNQFLRNTFPVATWQRIRLLENLGVSLPFILVQSIAGDWLPAGVTLVLAAVMSGIPVDRLGPLTIPTPFSRRPFEFTIGFRRTWVIVLGLYILTLIAVSVGNFNLGAFALVALFLLAMGYYNEPEPVPYVWIHAQPPREFLLGKMQAGTVHLFMLCTPVLLVLGAGWPEHILILGALLLTGWLYTIAMLLGKYAAYPSAMNLPLGLLLALAVSFPPLLIGLIPYYHKRAVRRLQPYLT